jgi:hypothetical protein
MMHVKHAATPGLEYKFVKFEPAKLDAATGEAAGGAHALYK